MEAGGALTAAMLLLLDNAVLRGTLCAVFVHELGHILALRMCGARILQIRAEFGGLCLYASALASCSAEIFCALAGPVAGLLWAALPGLHGGLSAGLSLLLSFYNLLPALPLDGGRALLALTGSMPLLRITTVLSAALLLALALWAPLPLLLVPALRLWLSAFRA